MTLQLQFPPGKYWIGDPCYVDSSTDGFSWRHGTALGDGVFNDNRGFTYYVDSGTLGVFPVADLSPETRGGRFVTQRKPFTPTYEGGKFTFGTVVIDTET